jgi:predicted class III extradiol MEMO1 family dioxygenase
MTETRKIRPAAVAGRFYSGKKLELEREVAMYLENAPDIDIPGQILGIVAPHAGYMYSAGVAARAYRHRFDEHALEVQLPLLQKVLDHFTLLPIIIGEQNYDNLDTLAKALGTVLHNRNALIVASSDLSHFYDTHKAETLDSVVSNDIKNFNEDDLFAHLNSGDCEMCGGGPVVATMKACKLLGADQSRVLKYRTSGDITGDQREVVGYLSAVFYKSDD